MFTNCCCNFSGLSMILILSLKNGLKSQKTGLENEEDKHINLLGWQPTL